MIDREKVIGHLNDCMEASRRDNTWVFVRNDIVEDALALLKEQKAVKLKTGHWIYKKYDDMFMCSCCEKYSIRNDYPYCHWCGAKMEGR